MILYNTFYQFLTKKNANFDYVWLSVEEVFLDATSTFGE